MVNANCMHRMTILLLKIFLFWLGAAGWELHVSYNGRATGSRMSPKMHHILIGHFWGFCCIILEWDVSLGHAHTTESVVC